MNKKGFTLIELLVVIAIIGILSSVVLASLNTARVKARDAQRVSDVRQIQLALEFFYDNSAPSAKTYPTDGEGIAILDTQNLLPNVPVAPSNSNAAGGNAGYAYNQLSTTNYCVGVGMEQATAIPTNDQNCDAGTPVAPNTGSCTWASSATCYSIGP